MSMEVTLRKLCQAAYIPVHSTMTCLCVGFPSPERNKGAEDSKVKALQSSPHSWERARVIANPPWGCWSAFPLIYYVPSPQTHTHTKICYHNK